MLALLAVALATLALSIVRTSSVFGAAISVATAAALFAVMFLFWLGRKVGAGDVKLFGIVPMLVGYEAMLPMALATVVFSAALIFVMKYPVLLPERLFRTYVASMDATGRIPFGVPEPHKRGTSTRYWWFDAAKAARLKGKIRSQP